MRKLVAILVGGLVLSIAAAWPAGADTSIRPTFRPSNVYFHCNGPTRVYNLNWLAGLGDVSTYVPWDANPPAGSVQDGAGCIGGDEGQVTNEVYDVCFAGTFTGNLRDLTVRLHEFLVGNTRAGSTQMMRVYAEVDGIPVFPKGATAGGYDGRAFTVTPQSENSGATALFEFSISNLGFAKEVRDANGNLIDVQRGGVALENGDGTEEHAFRIMVGLDTFVGDDPPTGADLWVWDTTEVPSGITFNPSTLAGDTVKADLPDLSQG
ncbi:MAG: hypothetical protein ABR600_13430 [Actinomycetota bacterium]